ncbi:MAG: hypothetical protein WC365_04740 [Candidatus Babeliales bacterium]|jgi:hypothetical protein
MSRSSSRLLTLSALVYATNSIMVAQQPAPSPSRTIIKAVETTTAVVKKHPEFLDKIDVTASDIIVTAKKRADIIKNEIPTDERKAIEKAVKEEAEEAYAEIKNIFKHRSDRIKNKVDAVIGSEKREEITDGIEADVEELDARAQEIKLAQSCKELGKDIKAAHQKNMAN